LESAITNLAINARDAMPSGGHLGITARNTELDEDYAAHNAEVIPGEYVMMEISDDGTGIAPDTLARVFEPFFTTKPVGQGTGLGLSMVFGFIKQSGGHIRIYSELGMGTSVRLYFPRAHEGNDARPLTGASADAIPGGHETVLVVEDNEDVRRMVRNQLTEFGYGVLVAEHGPAAMVVLGSDAPIDLLFTDVVMPEGMTGFVLAEEALRLRPGLKVLITSGFPGDSFHRPPAGAAQWAFLSKPYRKRDLACAVRDALDGKGAIP
jgi:CheY-like chemotaxis protein